MSAHSLGSWFPFLTCKCGRFSIFCSNEFRTLIFCILTFGSLRKCTKPGDILSHHIRRYLHGQVPKSVLLVTVLITPLPGTETQEGTSPRAPPPRAPGRPGRYSGTVTCRAGSPSRLRPPGSEQDPLLRRGLFPDTSRGRLRQETSTAAGLSRPRSLGINSRLKSPRVTCLPFQVSFFKESWDNNLISLESGPLLPYIFHLWSHLTERNSDIKLRCLSLVISQNIFFLTPHNTFTLNCMGHELNVNSAYEGRCKDKHSPWHKFTLLGYEHNWVKYWGIRVWEHVSVCVHMFMVISTNPA